MLSDVAACRRAVQCAALYHYALRTAHMLLYDMLRRNFIECFNINIILVTYR